MPGSASTSRWEISWQPGANTISAEPENGVKMTPTGGRSHGDRLSQFHIPERQCLRRPPPPPQDSRGRGEGKVTPREVCPRIELCFDLRWEGHEEDSKMCWEGLVRGFVAKGT